MAGFGPNGGVQGVSNATTPFTNPATVTNVTATGTFTTQPGTTLLDYLVVGGGGGGGAGYGGGGAGGGYVTSFCCSCRGQLTVTGATGYPVTIGAKGVGGVTGGPAPLKKGGCGPDSVVVMSPVTVTATGGGGGGGEGNEPGKTGGSGGGGAGALGCGGAGNTPPLSPVQGFAGGTAGPNSKYAGGGGGGASAVGVDGTTPGQAGPGGNGKPNTISPSYPGGTVFGGGGGGATYSGCGPGCGGTGGGGDAGNTSGSPGCPAAPGCPGTDGLGGGGGAGGFDPVAGHHTGGTGGDGVVIIKEVGATGFTAPGVWPQKAQYDNAVAGTW